MATAADAAVTQHEGLHDMSHPSSQFVSVTCEIVLHKEPDLKVYLQPVLPFCICSNRYITDRVTMPSSVSPANMK